jgi:predicted choloylglycine hydrolase
MCTAIRLKTKDLYFGRHLDYHCSYGQQITLTPRKFPLTFRDAGALNAHYAILGMARVDNHYPLYFDAINEKGLAIAVLSAKGHITCQRTGRIGLTTSSAIRVVLDCCATVREAVETLSRFDMYPSRGSNYHFQLADAFGDYAVMEYADGQMHVLKEQYVTNFFLTPDVSDDRCGQDRYDKLKKTMDGNGGVFRDTSDAMKALAEVSEDGTRWSAVFNVTDRSLHLALEHDYTGTYNFSLDVPEL